MSLFIKIEGIESSGHNALLKIRHSVNEPLQKLHDVKLYPDLKVGVQGRHAAGSPKFIRVQVYLEFSQFSCQFYNVYVWTNVYSGTLSFLSPCTVYIVHTLRAVALADLCLGYFSPCNIFIAPNNILRLSFNVQVPTW